MSDQLATVDNLIEIMSGSEPVLGPWSTYYLAEIAIIHYFPDVGDNPGDQARKLPELNCNDWCEVIIKYHKDIGYSEDILSNKMYVNAY